MNLDSTSPRSNLFQVFHSHLFPSGFIFCLIVSFFITSVTSCNLAIHRGYRLVPSRDEAAWFLNSHHYRCWVGLRVSTSFNRINAREKKKERKKKKPCLDTQTLSLCSCANPTARINVGNAFSANHRFLQPYISHTVLVVWLYFGTKTTRFQLGKHLALAWNISFVSTNMARNCPEVSSKVSSGVTLTNVETPPSPPPPDMKVSSWLWTWYDTFCRNVKMVCVMAVLISDFCYMFVLVKRSHNIDIIAWSICTAGTAFHFSFSYPH